VAPWVSGRGRSVGRAVNTIETQHVFIMTGKALSSIRQQGVPGCHDPAVLGGSCRGALGCDADWSLISDLWYPAFPAVARRA